MHALCVLRWSANIPLEGGLGRRARRATVRRARGLREPSRSAAQIARAHAAPPVCYPARRASIYPTLPRRSAARPPSRAEKMIYRIVFALLAGKASGFAAFHDHDHDDNAKMMGDHDDHHCPEPDPWARMVGAMPPEFTPGIQSGANFYAGVTIARIRPYMHDRLEKCIMSSHTYERHPSVWPGVALTSRNMDPNSILSPCPILMSACAPDAAAMIDLTSGRAALMAPEPVT